MTILLSNDDGVFATGLSLSFDAVKNFADCVVVAPDTNCSGKSQSLTLERPMRKKTHYNGFHSIDGTPADCVHLAISGLLDEVPTRVVSGINHGANLGDDVLYSGTVAAAMEGRMLAKPAIAISSVGHSEANLIVAAQVLQDVMARIDELELPRGTILNVNVPACRYDEIRGFKLTRLGHRTAAQPPIRDTDPRGVEIWWLGGVGQPLVAEEGTDFHAVANNYVSITPLQYDKTDYVTLKTMASWLSIV